MPNEEILNIIKKPKNSDEFKIHDNIDNVLDSPIYVTQPALPDLQEFIPYLEQIWENKILTNNGPFHQQQIGRASCRERV